MNVPTYRIVIVAVLVTACGAADSRTLAEARQRYERAPSAESALALAEAYNTVHTGSLEETQQGLASIDRLIARHSDTYRLRVLKGNLLTIQGGHYSRVKDYAAALERMAEGFQAIDRTVADHPDDPYVRIYRAINAVSVPPMFDRRDVAFADFALLYAMGADATGREIRILTLYHYARLAREFADPALADRLDAELHDRYPDYRQVVDR